MSNVTYCGNCGAQIKESSVFSSNKTYNENAVTMINKVFDQNNSAYCLQCRPKVEDLMKKIEALTNFLNTNLYYIPIITTHSPFNWDYHAISIVTGQSVIGTGLISEFKSSFTDFFGMSSSSFAGKIATGEANCMLQLRMKALNVGANAIIATDIDYGELGSVKGMIMVCAAGTAIRLNNLEIAGVNPQIINDLVATSDKLKTAMRLKEVYIR